MFCIGTVLTTFAPTYVPPNYVSDMPENCTFESGMCQWKNNNSDGGFDWIKQTGYDVDGNVIGNGPTQDISAASVKCKNDCIFIVCAIIFIMIIYFC